MTRADRRRLRTTGVYFTPPEVVRYIVRHTLQPLLAEGSHGRPLRILEPACGEGVFLEEVIGFLERRQTRESLLGNGDGRRPVATDGVEQQAVHREILAHNSCFGVDVDAEFVASTRRRLAELVADGDSRTADRVCSELAGNIVWGDALLAEDFESLPAGSGRRAPPMDWRKTFPNVFRDSADAGFDAIVGNPPYVNIRLLARTVDPAVRSYLRRRYRCAEGAYDLYVLFIEQAFNLLRPGGMCGMIVPNKLATLQYARACRTLLLERTTLHRIVDLSSAKVFADANVYPYVVIWSKQPAPVAHSVQVFRADSIDGLSEAVVESSIDQRQLSAARGLCLHDPLNVEARVPTCDLGQAAELHSGTTGFSASQVAAFVREAEEPAAPSDSPFVVSGNIDRYRIRAGNVRFMGQRYRFPVLSLDAACLSDGKRRLYRSPKILVSGMTRRLEAAWDPDGLALGVQVYAVIPTADAFYVLGLLNSKLLTYLFRTRFQAKRLAGGYFAVNKGQLGQLPIRVIDADALPDDQRQRAELIRLVTDISRLSADGEPAGPEDGREITLREIGELDRRIDAIVYQLYRLSAAEIALVESACPV